MGLKTAYKGGNFSDPYFPKGMRIYTQKEVAFSLLRLFLISLKEKNGESTEKQKSPWNRECSAFS